LRDLDVVSELEILGKGDGVHCRHHAVGLEVVHRLKRGQVAKNVSDSSIFCLNRTEKDKGTNESVSGVDKPTDELGKDVERDLDSGDRVNDSDGDDENDAEEESKEDCRDARVGPADVKEGTVKGRLDQYLRRLQDELKRTEAKQRDVRIDGQGDATENDSEDGDTKVPRLGHLVVRHHRSVVVVLERGVALLAGTDRFVRRSEAAHDLSAVVKNGVDDGGDVDGEEAAVEDDLELRMGGRGEKVRL
jgi:hypothetical protein